jgi:hypothetical protein
VYPGCKIKFNLKYSPYVTGLGTIKNIYTGYGISCVYNVVIEEVEEHNFYMAGDEIFIFPKEIVKEVKF